MASSGLRREKYLLTIGILRFLEDRYAAMPLPGRVLQLLFTNLRNRPLSSTTIDSMRESILGLYHNLITGSTEYPVIHYRGSYRSRLMATPFVQVEQRENAAPCPLMEAPSGLMVSTAGSSSTTPVIRTPALPEKTDLVALKADRRNCVRHMEVDGRTVTRVISPVFHSDGPVLTNRWRVSDYREDGQVLGSALCRFTRESAGLAPTRRQSRKRKDSSSRQSPPKKRFRV